MLGPHYVQSPFCNRSYPQDPIEEIMCSSRRRGYPQEDERFPPHSYFGYLACPVTMGLLAWVHAIQGQWQEALWIKSSLHIRSLVYFT